MSLRQNYGHVGTRNVQFSYQSECHCAKTHFNKAACSLWFSYQSECHCAKTKLINIKFHNCLVTSQNVTAPKRLERSSLIFMCLVTSQNVTAPKQTCKEHYHY